MKKWTKVLFCVLGLGFLLGGCATVSNITNNNEELIYNGNSAVMVDGYLYYGNAFSDYSTFKSDDDYVNNARNSYLARLNTNIDLAAKNKDYSPKVVEKVSEEVTGYSKNFMFVLGQNIYYATPNRQKATNSEGETANYYNYTCIYKSGLDGNHKSKVYTTNAEISEMEVLKADGKYYIVMLAGSNLIVIDLSNNRAETIAENVGSIAIPKTYQKDKLGSSLDWDGYIYYTTTRENTSGSGNTGNIVNRIKVSGGEKEELYNQGTSLTFVGREKDVVFFAETVSGNTEVYMSDLTNSTNKNDFRNKKKRFYSASTVSDITLIATDNLEYGYVFTTNSKMGFVTKSGDKSGVISFKTGEGDLSSYKTLFITGRTVYMSTTTGIYRASIADVFANGTTEVSCDTIVTMTAIQDGTLYAFDGTYIYYYAKLEEVEKEEDSEETEPESDDNYYMYRAKVNRTNEYQLIGLTSIDSRKTK